MVSWLVEIGYRLTWPAMYAAAPVRLIGLTHARSATGRRAFPRVVRPQRRHVGYCPYVLVGFKGNGANEALGNVSFLNNSLGRLQTSLGMNARRSG
jgi:hypothetical protein